MGMKETCSSETFMPSKAFSKPTKFLSKTRLRLAWSVAKARGRSSNTPGVDGKSGRDFAQNLDSNLAEIANQISRGEYKFSKLRCIWLPKAGQPDKERLICVPTISDRLVQRTIAGVLEQDNRLGIASRVSFGFQQGLGVQSAIDAALSHRNGQQKWVVKTDICSFFDMIDRKILISKFNKIGPRSLTGIMEQVISCEAQPHFARDFEKLKKSGVVNGKGLRQGMPLSPILSNLELAGFDRRAQAAGFSLVRYADDLAVFCESKPKAKQAFENIKTWLEELGHTIPELTEGKKSKLIPPLDPIEFLGFEIAFDDKSKKYIQIVPERSIKKIITETREDSTFKSCVENKLSFSDIVKNLAAKKTSYSVYAKASNYNDFKRRLEITSRDAMRCLLIELFGKVAIQKLDMDKLNFLGLASFQEVIS